MKIAQLPCGLALALIILAVFFPTIGLGGRREASRRAECQSHLKQLARALRMYAQDNDETLPAGAQWSNVAEANLRGFSRQSPNTRSAQLFCPADQGAATTDSYAMNRKMSLARLSSEPKPDQAVLLFESDLHVPNAIGTERDLAVPGRHIKQAGPIVRGAVSRGNNFAFLDGHVKWLQETPELAAGRKVRGL